MPRLILIEGERKADRSRLIEELLPHLAKRGLKIGVVVHRRVGEGEEPGGRDTERYSRAGAAQVMFTRGTELGFSTKRGGITPLKRVAARYFNAVDILLADGYFDPVPRIEVDLSGEEREMEKLYRPGLLAAVFKRSCPGAPVPVFSLFELEKLVNLILAH